MDEFKSKQELIDFCAAGHYDLWNWLSENPEADKEDWPEWEDKIGIFEGHYINCMCFGCLFNMETDEGCLLEHKYRCDNYIARYCLGGLYRAWCEAGLNERPEIAKKIRDLPVRKDI